MKIMPIVSCVFSSQRNHLLCVMFCLHFLKWNCFLRRSEVISVRYLRGHGNGDNEINKFTNGYILPGK